MNSVFSNLSKSIKILFSDKVILLLGSIPVIIGAILYTLLGKWLYNLIMVEGQDFIQSKIGDGSGAGIIYWLLLVVFSILLFFVVNWTFVMIVSIFASPFNDAISSRVEKKHKGIALLESEMTFKKILSNLYKTVFTEIKKVLIILLLTLFALVLSLIPVLAPLTIVISALLLTVQFVDYSWARHEWSAGKCFGDLLRHFFSYFVAGAIFMFFMSIPGINLFALPVAVIYFTLLFVDKNEKNLPHG